MSSTQSSTLTQEGRLPYSRRPAYQQTESFLAEAIVYYYDHPTEFVEDLIGATPEPEQRQVLDAIAKYKRVAVKSGHGIGKTACEAWTILWFLFTRPLSRIPCTAPTYHQLEDVLWPEVHRWLGQSAIKDYLVWSKKRLSIAGHHEEEWFAVARSCSDPDNLSGFHGRELLFVIDEAAGIPQDIMQVIEGTLTNEGAKILMCGNPTQLAGTFYHAFHKDRQLYKPFTFNAEESRLVSEQYCRDQATKYGRDSDVYKVRVLGEFPTGQPDTLIRLDVVEAALRREVKAEGKIEIGVDPARFGDDQSVICWRRGLQVQPLRSFHGIDTTRLTGEVARLVLQLRSDGYEEVISVKIDDTGVGGGVTDQLVRQQADLKIQTIPVLFGGVATKAEYADYGSEMWGNIKEALETIQLPADDELVAQLTTRKYQIKPDGTIKLERKEDMKKRGISSPDKADALVLCFAMQSVGPYRPKDRRTKSITAGLMKERF